MYVLASCACLVPAEHPPPPGLELQMAVSHLLLGTEPRSYARAAGTLYYVSISMVLVLFSCVKMTNAESPGKSLGEGFSRSGWPVVMSTWGYLDC